MTASIFQRAMLVVDRLSAFPADLWGEAACAAGFQALCVRLLTGTAVDEANKTEIEAGALDKWRRYLPLIGSWSWNGENPDHSLADPRAEAQAIINATWMYGMNFHVFNGEIRWQTDVGGDAADICIRGVRAARPTFRMGYSGEHPSKPYAWDAIRDCDLRWCGQAFWTQVNGNYAPASLHAAVVARGLRPSYDHPWVGIYDPPPSPADVVARLADWKRAGGSYGFGLYLAERLAGGPDYLGALASHVTPAGVRAAFAWRN